MREQYNGLTKKSIWNLSVFLKMKFLKVCPYGKRYLEILVRKCIWEMMLLTALAIPILMIWNRLFGLEFGLFLPESFVLTIYLIFNEVPAHHLFQKETRVYQELLLYFSRVKHRYFVCKHGANAVVDAAEGMSYEIVCLAEEIYRLLLECNRKEKIRECILYHPLNRYLKMFLLQIYEISEKGDLYFAENIEHLRLELMEEIYRRKKRAHEFAGYVFVTVVPFFFLPVLKQWGLAFSNEMEVFYREFGTFLETITFLVTLFVYEMILRAKEVDFRERSEERKIWNTELLYGSSVIDRMVRRMETRCEGYIGRKIQCLILQSGEKIRYGELCVKMLFLGFVAFLILGSVLQNFVVSLVGGVCIGISSLFRLYFQGKQIKDGAVHEVRQFQSILLMERKMQGITVTDLLEDMELFSKCFRNCLRRCINAYSSDPKGALLKLKEEGSALHHSFGELADSFLSVDEAGVELSFAEIENNRTLLDKMTKLEEEIHMERKKDSVDLFSRVPGFFTMGMYFILPVFGYSLRGVSEVFRLLEEIKF